MTDLATAPDPANRSMAEELFEGCANEDEVAERAEQYLATLSATDAERLPFSWKFWSRATQRPPTHKRWKVWMVRAGRGHGKTRTGAEETRRQVREGRAGRIGIVGPTAADVRDILIEGESGILAVHPPGTRPKYEPSKRRLTWPNGATGTTYSAEEPDRLRGPAHDWIWFDEPASYKSGPAAFDNAMFGLRVGPHPQCMITGTPRRLKWMQDLEKEASTVLTTGTTYENIANLSESFIELMLGKYEGTRLGRQELRAEYLDDVEGALWTMLAIELNRTPRFDPANPHSSIVLDCLKNRLKLGGPSLPVMRENPNPWVIYVGVDPPGETAECGIVVATAPKGGRQGYDHCVILEDASMQGTPEEWGSQVVATLRKWNAAKVVVEKNNGGDMVRSTIHAVDTSVPVEKITAKDSKYDRAEPISTLTAKGWIHFAGYLPELENQLTTTTFAKGEKSPDRLDAFVHVCTACLSPTPVVYASFASPIRRTG